MFPLIYSYFFQGRSTYTFKKISRSHIFVSYLYFTLNQQICQVVRVLPITFLTKSLTTVFIKMSQRDRSSSIRVEYGTLNLLTCPEIW